MATRTERGRTSAKKAAERRRSWLSIGAVAAAALFVVAAFVGMQAMTAGGTTVPAPVASAEGRTLGDPDAPVTIIEYADFQCPSCRAAAAEVMPQIEREYVEAGLVNVEFRMLPVLGDESWYAAVAAEAARDQGMFWEYAAALFNAQAAPNNGAYSYERLVAIAEDTGLDVERFEESLRTGGHLETLEREVQAALDAGVTSTPTFFVGDEKIVGAQPYSVIEEAIERALADAR